MHIVLVTPTPLLADCLRSALLARDENTTIDVLESLTEFQARGSSLQADAVLIDVTQGLDWDTLSQIAGELSQSILWALGPEEELHNLKQQGHGVFAGYLSRSSSIEDLYGAISARTGEPPTPRHATCGEASGSWIMRFSRRLNPFRLKKSGGVKSP